MEGTVQVSEEVSIVQVRPGGWLRVHVMGWVERELELELEPC